jgi:hypothetical protein
VVADVYRRWAAGQSPDAAAALADHPELWEHTPLVLELAYEEFCLRVDGGTAPNPAAFAARFGPLADSVARLLAVHSVIGRHPSLAAGGRPAVELAAGETVGELRVVRRLGVGGFSHVYLVTDTATGGRPLVLKVSTRGDHEATTLGRLKHDHVMPVWYAPRVGDLRAVLSPYLGLATGETLLERTAAGDTPSAEWLLRVAADRPAGDPTIEDAPAFPLTPSLSYPQAVLHLAAALATALAYSHGKGIAHRDLKPSNILLAPTGHPYLLDFNLADDGRGGRVGGTVAYAPPEVLAALRSGEPNPSGDWFAADVFSFAVLACELLLTRHPYLTADTLTHVDEGAVARAAGGAAAVAARLPVPPAVRRLLARCLSVNPPDRPTAAVLAGELAKAVAPRRRRVWAWVRVAAAVLAVGGGAGWAVYAADLPPTHPFARGCWLVRHDQPDAAAAAFTEAEATDPSGRATEWLAYCHARSGNHQTARECGDRAVAAGRHTVAVFANRAAARLGTGDPSGAADDAGRAVALDPTCRAARLTLAKANYRGRPKGGAVDRGLLDALEVAAADGADPAVWVIVAEARLLVARPTDEDVARSLEAVRQARRLGYPPENLKKYRTLSDRLDPDQFRSALDTPTVAPPKDVQPYLVRPDW